MKKELGPLWSNKQLTVLWSPNQMRNSCKRSNCTAEGDPPPALSYLSFLFQVINNSVWVLVSAPAWIIRATWMILAGLAGRGPTLSDVLHRQSFPYYPEVQSFVTCRQSTFSLDSAFSILKTYITMVEGEKGQKCLIFLSHFVSAIHNLLGPDWQY